MAGYYVRFRGQVTGPFESAEVRRLYTRELLTPAHEVSTDRTHWRPLGAAGGVALADEPEVDEASDAAGEDQLTALLAAGGGAAEIGTPGELQWSSRPGKAAALARVTAVSCGLLLLFTAWLPVAWDGGPRFWWDGGAVTVALGLLTIVLALATVATAAVRDAVIGRRAMVALGAAGVLLNPFAGVGSGLLLGVAVWQTVVGAAALGATATLCRRGEARHVAIVAGAVLAAGALVTSAAALIGYAGERDPAGRYVVLVALRLAVATAAWVTLAGVGLIGGLGPRRADTMRMEPLT